MIHRGVYPANWPEIARRVKDAAGWRCERCGAKHGPVPAVLTVHHLDGGNQRMSEPYEDGGNQRMSEPYEGWAIVELMGHRRLAGRISEQQIAGAAFLRVDTPTEPAATQFYSAQAVYCITPTTENVATAVARQYTPQPVSLWEVRALASHRDDGEEEYDEEGEPG